MKNILTIFLLLAFGSAAYASTNLSDHAAVQMFQQDYQNFKIEVRKDATEDMLLRDLDFADCTLKGPVFTGKLELSSIIIIASCNPQLGECY